MFYTYLHILLCNHTIAVLPSTTWEHIASDKPLVSAAKQNAVCALLLILGKYTCHLSSSLNSTFSFSFGSAAPRLPSLHFAFSCVFWVITVTPHPKSLLWETAPSSPWSYCGPPCPRSLISHLKGKLSAKALGLACCLSENYFHSVALFYCIWWMVPTFYTQGLLVWGKRTGAVINTELESLFKSRIRFPEVFASTA